MSDQTSQSQHLTTPPGDLPQGGSAKNPAVSSSAGDGGNGMARMHYLKFYPESWIAESSLRLCSLAARGLWIELICRMAQSPEHGVLLSPGGKPVRDDQIPALVGGPHDGVMAALAELGSEGVLSRRTPDGAIYSRRMVRDHEKYVEQSESGERGANKRWGLKGTPKASPSGTLKGDPKASVDSRFCLLDSNSPEGECKGETEPDDGFDEFWAAYPGRRKDDKQRVRARWIREGLSDASKRSAVMANLAAWKVSDEWTKDGGRFICAPLVWFNKGRWENPPPASLGADGNVKPVKVDPHAADRALAAKWYLTLDNDQRREASGVVNIDQWADIARKGVVSDPILASWRASKSTGSGEKVGETA